MMGINTKTLPGILLCAILAIPCWLLGQHFHFIGSPIFAIILGIIIGSLFTSWKREKTGAGIGFTSKKSYNGPLSFSALVLTSPKYCM